MRILIITPYYSPDLGPSAPLFTMLGEGLAKHGHSVTVITTVPHYPSGHVSENYSGRSIWKYKENGVDTIRIAVPSIKRANLALRLVQFLCYQMGADWAGLRHRIEYDTVIVAGNPARIIREI